MLRFQMEKHMSRYARLGFSALLIAVAMLISAFAAINKCVGADGKVVFSDQACTTGQAATTIKAPAKPAAPVNKATADSSAPNTDHSRPNLMVYDNLCAEDQRLFDRDAGKLSPEDRGLRKERLDKRCNPQARLAAAEQDKENLVQVCKIKRKELEQNKMLPERPPGYGSRAPEIASAEAWLKANCN